MSRILQLSFFIYQNPILFANFQCFSFFDRTKSSTMQSRRKIILRFRRCLSTSFEIFLRFVFSLCVSRFLFSYSTHKDKSIRSAHTFYDIFVESTVAAWRCAYFWQPLCAFACLVHQVINKYVHTAYIRIDYCVPVLVRLMIHRVSYLRTNVGYFILV